MLLGVISRAVLNFVLYESRGDYVVVGGRERGRRRGDCGVSQRYFSCRRKACTRSFFLFCYFCFNGLQFLLKYKPGLQTQDLIQASGY